ncbi:cytosine deaminase [Puniceicoccus vermicola]|uniref:Amidohydrolase family protein n=1 Tax=Puniceicoccus vermicola TaxID=388746 RepID=A0A7X1B0X0_9BACT|nr:cytosine deaminase [Puniceicoccus vermicola]MBC2603595.1 amidohydrolase family protein [Puniceicoccus vermicola]
MAAESNSSLAGVFNARLPQREGRFRLSFSDGLLTSISPESSSSPSEGWIDAKGGLVTPPFVDPHFHLDSVHSIDETGENVSGTLLEGIALWKKYKTNLRPDQILERARTYCQEVQALGLQAIRSHVDVSYESLAGVEALIQLRDEFAGKIDIQLVAFPQDGFYRNPQGEALLLKALDTGIDVIGGIPHFERTYDEGSRSVDRICQIAADRGIRVDLHCDETDDGASHHVETLAAKTIQYGLTGRTAASHTTSLHSADDAWFAKLLPLLGEAGITIIPNPLINLTLQGRFDHYPKRRGITRIPELDSTGIPVALGQDCVRDPWYPLGTGNLLDVAHMTVHGSQMTGIDQMNRLLPMISSNGATAMGLKGYSLKENEPAHLLIFQESSFIELLRKRPRPTTIIRTGEEIEIRSQ